MLELIFFTAASMGLCFGSVLGTVLITAGCFSDCWAGLTEQGPSCSLPHPTREWAGRSMYTRSMGTHSRDSWPQPTQGTSQTMWCHAGEEEGSGGCSEWWHLPSKSPLGVMEPCCPGMADHLPVLAVNEFLVLLCLAFALPVQLSVSQLTSFLNFSLPILPPSHWWPWGDEPPAGVRPWEQLSLLLNGNKIKL